MRDFFSRAELGTEYQPRTARPRRGTEYQSKEHWVTIRRYWPWLAIAGAGFVAHVGTAVLRLSTFFPSPKLLDFAGFYASAWAIRQGLSPYNLSLEWLQSLQTAQAIPLTPPVIFNPPFWPWLLQPLTSFSFPVAATIWLLLNLALLAWATIALADIAGYGHLPRTERGTEYQPRTSRQPCAERRAEYLEHGTEDRERGAEHQAGRRSSWMIWVPLFFLLLTFGPVFLDLTLGQTSVVLLATALAIGRSLSRLKEGGTWSRWRRSGPALAAAIAGGLAVGVKLFPLTWLGALPFLRRWRELLLMALFVVAIFVLGFVVSPTSSQEYGKYVWTERVATASKVTSVDDQALVAWLDRLVRPQTFAVSGFGVEQRTTVVWSPTWTVDARAVRWVGYALLALLMLPCLFLLLRVVPQQHEGAFYLWVLYGLLALLHIERYNHVLLLPAMAWLWGRTAPPGGGSGRWQRFVVVLAYALVGLSRLTHLWVMLLPAPWGPLAAGFGMYAVLLLGVAIVVSLWPSRAPIPLPQGLAE